MLHRILRFLNWRTVARDELAHRLLPPSVPARATQPGNTGPDPEA